MSFKLFLTCDWSASAHMAGVAANCRGFVSNHNQHASQAEDDPSLAHRGIVHEAFTLL